MSTIPPMPCIAVWWVAPPGGSSWRHLPRNSPTEFENRQTFGQDTDHQLTLIGHSILFRHFGEEKLLSILHIFAECVILDFCLIRTKTILGPLYLPYFFGVHPVDSWKQDKSQVAGASATNVRAAFEI